MHMLTRMPVIRVSRRQKVAAAAAASALGALSALGGTYAAFTATATAPPQTIASGVLDITFVGGTFSTAMTNTMPGDVIVRSVALYNNGTIGYKTVTLAQANLGTLLTTDPRGYSVAVFDAKLTPADPLDDTVVLADTELSVFAAQQLTLTLTDAQKAAGAITNLRFVYTFDAAADSTFEGLSDTINFTVNATQRDAGTFVETSPTGTVNGL